MERLSVIGYGLPLRLLAFATSPSSPTRRLAVAFSLPTNGRANA
jgi:hypothetical protein